jgi:uncharacterized membrane protein YgdD (TMEM256/DUF423 family)
LAVTTGAFGAHVLKFHHSAEMTPIYKTGVEYHFYHALGLLLIGVLSISMPSGFIELVCHFSDRWNYVILS